MNPQKCVILIGHGGIPSDCPPDLVGEFKAVEAACQGKPTPEFLELDRKIRSWPRTAQTDPYQAGLEALAAALRKKLPARLVLAAYNEFCAPSLAEAFQTAVRQGVTEVLVVTTMYTRGGAHSEKEIPAIISSLRQRHGGVLVRYAWPFDLEAVSEMLLREIRRAENSPVRA